MVLKQLHDDLDVVVIVFDGYHTQDVGGVLGVRVLAVLVGQHQARVSLLDLQSQGNTERGIEAKSFGLSLGLTLSGLGVDLGLMASGLGLIEFGLVASNIYSAHDIN